MSFKILFIGSNPSNRSPSSNAFHKDTKSSKILNDWCAQLEPGSIESLHYGNVYNRPTPNNRALTMREIKDSLISLDKLIHDVTPDKIVAFGKAAETALTLLHVQHLAMPHPSGRNRLLNDKDFVAQKIKQLREYLSCSKELNCKD